MMTELLREAALAVVSADDEDPMPEGWLMHSRIAALRAALAAVPSESDAGLDALATFARWFAPHLTVERSHAIAAEYLDSKVRRRG